MNTKLATEQGARLLATSLATAAAITTLLAAPLPLHAADKKDATSGFVEKMKEWQDKMTDTFHNAWEGWQTKNDGHSVAAASVDLREQKDSYMLRLNLPNRDLNKVDIKLEGESLHIAV